MGREVKRVDVDFDWPLENIWGGFVNPYYSQRIECPECSGSGSSPFAKLLSDQWYGNAYFEPESRGSKPFSPNHPIIAARAKANVSRSPGYYGSGSDMVQKEAQRLCDLFNCQWGHHLNERDVAALIESERLKDLTHIFTPGKGWQPKEPAHTPTPEEVNEWSLSGIGHDSINNWCVVSAECKRCSEPEMCSRCGGEGDLWPTDEIKAAYDDWKDTEPPEGEGWQVWETVSEGSPITPVFPTRDGLIDYLVEYGDKWDQKRGDGGWKRENAESFVDAEWAPSLIGTAGKLRAPRDTAPVPAGPTP